MASTPGMFHYDTRLQSFQSQTQPSTSKSKKSKSTKPAFPLTANLHPNLTPTNLARAGFFHDPGQDEESWDTCKCFLCGLKLGGWDTDDDPFEEHVKRGSCAWAEFVCGPIVHRAKKTRPSYLTPESLPSSAESSTFRQMTYGKAWPHKQRSGWLPTIKNLSKAGFVLNATTEFKDMVLCPFCDYGVDGWEAEDDPWTRHHTKSPKCPFFVAQVEGAPSLDDQAPIKARRVTKVGGARAKRGATAMSEAPSEIPEITIQEPIDDPAPAQTSKPARKPRQTTRAKGKKKEEEGEVEQVEQSEAEPAPVGEVQEVTEEKAVKEKRPTRGRPKGSKKDKEDVGVESQMDVESQAEAEVEELPKKTRAVKGVKGKSGKEKKVKEVESQVEVESQAEVEDSQAEMEESQAEMEDSHPIKNSVKGGKKTKSTTTTKSKSKSKSKSQPEEVSTNIASDANVEGTRPASASASEVETINIPSVSQSSRSNPSSKSSRPKTTSSSSSRTKDASKPLPPLPADSTPQPSKPQSQLDKFANIPPSSPFPHPSSPADTTPRPKAPMPKIKRASNVLSRETLDQSVMLGAVEARRVMEDVLLNPPSKPAEPDGILSDEQKKMTLEDFVRYEMKKRYEIMEKEGEAMIGKWEDTTRQARRRIEGL